MSSQHDDEFPDRKAPDLQILGDDISLHPSGIVEEKDDSRHDRGERVLLQHMASFRSEPLKFLREVSLHISGTGWRAYDNVIGQKLFYPGFSENMKEMVLASPLLQAKIVQMADMRCAVLERKGWIDVDNPDYLMNRLRYKNNLVSQLNEVASEWTDKMICKFENKRFIRSAYYLVTQLLLRAYHQGIHVSSEEVLRLRKIAQEAEKNKQSIIFLPCHKSHVDYVSMQLVCYRLGLGLPVVVAGDNLNFPVVGSFLQHAGAMWIKRSFSDNMLYTALVQSYIDTLLQGGYNFECFIEGGRSRTGKLLSPKFGILGFVLDSILSGRVKDAIICPVSTQYDKVIETEGYVTELLGMPKKKENLADFLTGGSSVLSLRLGRVDVRFQEPWSLRAFVDDQLSKVPKSLDLDSPSENEKISKKVRQRILRTLGYKVLADINDVSVVMPTALIGTVLLTLRMRGVRRDEMIERVQWLSERIKAKGGRVAHFGYAPLADVVERGLEVLGKDLVKMVPGLLEPTYYAVDRFQLSFYRNMTIHLFVSEALVCSALYTRIQSGEEVMSSQELQNHVLFLSSLFRGEFIFPGEGLEANLTKTLQGLEDDGVMVLQKNSDGVCEAVSLTETEQAHGRKNFEFYCFLIWPFVDAAWLAVVSLMGLTPPLGTSSDTWIEANMAQGSAQLLGKTIYHQGYLTYFEAVNKETLKNSYQRFQEEGILEVTRTRNDNIYENVPAKLRLSPDWVSPRHKTGELAGSGRLWAFIDKICMFRREGKAIRDDATIRDQIVRLVDDVGRQLFEDALEEPESTMLSAGEQVVTKGKDRRKLEGRSKL